MNREGLAQLFYREVEKITANPELQKLEKVNGFYRLLNLLFVELTRKERLHFTTPVSYTHLTLPTKRIV